MKDVPFLSLVSDLDPVHVVASIREGFQEVMAPRYRRVPLFSRESWATVMTGARRRGFTGPDPILPQAPRFLGTSVKVQAGEALGWSTSILYLSPAKESGAQLCPYAGQCAAVCLGHSSGRLRFSPARNSRRWKSAALLGAPLQAVRTIAREIAIEARRISAQGGRYAVRLDGSSDLGLGMLFSLVAKGAALPVTFYDYTKDRGRALAALQAWGQDYRLTFSASEKDDGAAVLAAGGNVSVVFSGDRLPSSWNGHQVIDGVAHDLRFLDDRPVIVGLLLKGHHKGGTLSAAAGFVHQV